MHNPKQQLCMRMKSLRNILLFLLLFAATEQVHASCSFGYYQVPSGNPEAIYFIHNNHLGSACWITNKTGVPAQYIHYAPYGELIVNQSTGYDERYKFIGKERDEESGYDNFGARYYIPPLGIWTRPDPLLNKYIDVSPYMYCEGNPIKYVDSKGTHPLVVGGVVYYNLTHQKEWNKMSDWKGDNQFSEVRDTRVGLDWQNRQERKAKRAAELQDMEHQQFLQDNLPDPSPDPNKGKDPKGKAEQVGKGTLVAIGIGIAAELYRAHKENTTPKIEIKNDTQTQENAETTNKQFE